MCLTICCWSDVHSFVRAYPILSYSPAKTYPALEWIRLVVAAAGNRGRCCRRRIHRGIRIVQTTRRDAPGNVGGVVIIVVIIVLVGFIMTVMIVVVVVVVVVAVTTRTALLSSFRTLIHVGTVVDPVPSAAKMAARTDFHCFRRRMLLLFLFLLLFGGEVDDRCCGLDRRRPSRCGAAGGDRVIGNGRLLVVVVAVAVVQPPLGNDLLPLFHPRGRHRPPWRCHHPLDDRSGRRYSLLLFLLVVLLLPRLLFTDLWGRLLFLLLQRSNIVPLFGFFSAFVSRIQTFLVLLEFLQNLLRAVAVALTVIPTDGIVVGTLVIAAHRDDAHAGGQAVCLPVIVLVVAIVLVSFRNNDLAVIFLNGGKLPTGFVIVVAILWLSAAASTKAI